MSTIFHNCLVVDGVSEFARENCDVIVEHERIVGIEDARSRSRDDHIVVDSEGMTIMPGLIDCHSHYLIYPWGADPFKLEVDGLHGRLVLRGARCANAALQSGVTTTRDAGAPEGLSLILRDAIRDGLILVLAFWLPVVLSQSPVVMGTSLDVRRTVLSNCKEQCERKCARVPT